MFSGNEWLIVVIVALVLFGGSQLPKFARSLGEAKKELTKAMKEGDEAAAQPPKATDNVSDGASS